MSKCSWSVSCSVSDLSPLMSLTGFLIVSSTFIAILYVFHWQLVECQLQYRARERQLQQEPHNRDLNSLDSHMTTWSVQLVICTEHKELTDTAMVLAVSHWPLATEALVWTKASACRLVGGWVVHWVRFFCSYCCCYVSLSFIPTMLHIHLFVCHLHQQLIMSNNAHQNKVDRPLLCEVSAFVQCIVCVIWICFWIRSSEWINSTRFVQWWSFWLNFIYWILFWVEPYLLILCRKISGNAGKRSGTTDQRGRCVRSICLSLQ